jgi:hypothetical protein
MIGEQLLVSRVDLLSQAFPPQLVGLILRTFW